MRGGRAQGHQGYGICWGRPPVLPSRGVGDRGGGGGGGGGGGCGFGVAVVVVAVVGGGSWWLTKFLNVDSVVGCEEI